MTDEPNGKTASPPDASPAPESSTDAPAPPIPAPPVTAGDSEIDAVRDGDRIDIDELVISDESMPIPRRRTGELSTPDIAPLGPLPGARTKGKMDRTARRRRFQALAVVCLLAWIVLALVTDRLLISLPLASIFFWWWGMRKESEH